MPLHRTQPQYMAAHLIAQRLPQPTKTNMLLAGLTGPGAAAMLKYVASDR